jgi:glycosyltransferase involved in cell wall biosynthesis
VKLKVLVIVDHAVGITGPHRNVVGSIQALAAREDLELTVLCGRHELKEETRRRIVVREGFEPHRLTRFFSNLRKARKAANDCDVLYVPTGLKSFLYAWLVKGRKPLVAGPNVSGIPFLMNVHNPAPLMTTRRADAWIEMSEVRARQCVRAGTPRERISLVPHSVDATLFSPEARDPRIWRQYGFPADSQVIVFTGRIEPVLKGIPQIIDAFRIIRRERPDTVLALIGRVQMDIEAFGQVPGVFFLGPKAGQDFAAHVASADLFIGASRYETFWFCPLEAMSCGVPVVVSEAGAVPEMIPENGKQGVRVSIITPEDQHTSDAARKLAEAAISLLSDEELRKRIGRKARAHVQREFSEAKQGERLVQVFRGVLQDQT